MSNNFEFRDPTEAVIGKVLDAAEFAGHIATRTIETFIEVEYDPLSDNPIDLVRGVAAAFGKLPSNLRS